MPESSSAPTPPHRHTWFGRLRRLTLKEMRETLRDRRTIITLILMPLLVYPILSMIFRSVLMSTLEGSFQGDDPIVLKIAFSSNRPAAETGRFISAMGEQVASEDRGKDSPTETRPAPNTPGVTKTNSLPAMSSGSGNADDVPPASPLSRPVSFAGFIEHQWLINEEEDPDSLQRLVLESDVDVGVNFEFPAVEQSGRLPDGAAATRITIVRDSSPASVAAARYLQESLQQVNEVAVSRALAEAGLGDVRPIAIEPPVIAVDGNKPPSTKTFSLAALIPLVLVLMTVTGAVYPAIDLTAGERERGTLETLMAAPVPKVSILLAKFFAVWTVAVFTAVLNLVGMAATVWTFQFEKILLGPGGFSLLVILKIFLLLILFAAFFSALLLAVTSFARSFKEAQAYLVPIILLSMGPGLMAMNPDLTLSGVWSIVPMVNVLLLGRDVINQDVDPVAASMAVGSTLLYAILAIRFAAHRFGGDGILYAQSGSISDLIARPKKPQSHFTMAAAMLALLLLLPVNLVAIGALGRMSDLLKNQYSVWAMMMAAFTLISFFGIPWLIAVLRRVRLSSGFAATMPRGAAWIPAVAMGLTMWPLLATFVDQLYSLSSFFVGTESANARHDMLIELSKSQVEKFRLLPVPVVALAFAIVPAICEEWFFRGMLLQTFLRSMRPWKAILLSAALFGFFHTLSNSAISLDRLIPTTLMGVLLGFVCYRTGSIWPGALLHMLHNASVVFMGYFEPQLQQLEWFPQAESSIPMLWVLVAAAVCVTMLMLLMTRVVRPLNSA